ncbi:28675_t:CDS:2 [Gigaspora margarita]|uniref:28675_t:CDS:1 n=1 Tax=Gigaspora margarita TaxID=4874 RepID=A0ABN7UL01_GIGMA|nr:28675_t:CDS:2 [Gigaspora margarita]
MSEPQQSQFIESESQSTQSDITQLQDDLYQSGYNALALLIASDELLIEQIVKHVQVHFIRKKSNWLKKNLPMVLSTISKLQSCKMMQDYIMTTIDLPIGSESTIHVLLVIADKLALIQLIDRIQKLLIKNEPSWLKKDLIGFLCKIFNDNKYKKIKYYIMDTICIDPEPLLFEFENFPTLEKDIILEFIKRDDLAIEEIDVWKYLVKWATEQNTDSPIITDINMVDSNFQEEFEFTLLKKNIEPFIPYIRFCEMTRDEFYYHVMPYEKILPENLYKNLIAYFMVNLEVQDVILRPRNGLISIDSSIIKGKHARIIIRWIEGINALTEKSFAEFTCIYRATDCKFEYQKFIKVLDSISSTSSSSKVLFIKVKNSDKIIGGYIGSHNFRDIFLPKERRNKDFILCLGSEKDSNFHICCNVRCPYTQRFNINGPWINFYSEGAHLKLYGQKGTCSVLNDRNFIAEEIEIFCINR